MAVRKSSKKKEKRHSVRRHRTSISGTILPPLDVRSTKSLSELKKRILKGPLTIVLVYADWCSHCHHIMPHWDEAVKSHNRSIQAVKVNETMLDQVNNRVNKSINQSVKPLEVDGYPTIIMVDKRANKVTNIEPVKDTETLTKVMEQSGNLVSQVPLVSNQPRSLNVLMDKPSTSTPFPVKSNESIKEILTNTSNNIKNVNKKMNMNVNSNNNGVRTNSMNVNMEGDEVENEMKREIMSKTYKPELKEGEEEQKSFLYTQTSPEVLEDLRSIRNLPPSNKLRGGGLYQAMSQATYTLAPAAILLATAASIMKNKSRRSKKRHHKTHKTYKKRN